MRRYARGIRGRTMREVRPGGQFRPLESGDPTAVAGYRLAARLGSGGMGTVYLSYTPGGHPIALKTIRPELSEDPEFRRRFRQEVRAAQRVQGLYTAPVIDFDTEGTSPWLATTYVPGPSLASAVGEHGPLPAATVLLLLAGMAEALSVIHGAGIVHRDLKPSNVLLAADGPRVIDFGIARAADATALTGTGVSVGTPAFMSPEQASGTAVTPASDVFSLGLVAAYAARGTSVYGDGPSHAVLYRIVHEEPDLDGLPEELGFIARCLTKDPADRPSPAELIALCQEASPTGLRQSGQWLPEAIDAEITQRTSASADLLGPAHTTPMAPPAPAPLPPPPTVPVTPSDATAPVPPPDATAVITQPNATAPAVPPHAAPTVHAAHSAQTAPQPLRTPPGPPPPPAHPGYPGHQSHPGHHAPSPQPPGWQPQPGPPRKNNAGRVIGILAAVLLPLGGCAALLSSIGDSTDDSGGGSGATSPSSAGTSAQPDPKPVTYRNVTIPKSYYVRFSDSPLKPIEQDAGNAVFAEGGDLAYDVKWYVSQDTSPVLGSQSEKLVLLNNAEKGSLKTCRTVTRYAKDVSLSQLSKGSQICVHTRSGHIGLVTFKGASSPSDPSDYVTVDVTVWRNAEQPTGEDGG